MDTSDCGSETSTARSRPPNRSNGAVVDNTENDSEKTVSIARSTGSESSTARKRSPNRKDGASVDNTDKHLLDEEKSESGGGEEDKMEEEKSDPKANGVAGGTDFRSGGLEGGARRRRHRLSPQGLEKTLPDFFFRHCSCSKFSNFPLPTSGPYSYGGVRRVRPDPPTPASMASPATTTMVSILLALGEAGRETPSHLEHLYLPPGRGTLNRPSPVPGPSPSASGPILEPGISIRLQGPPNSSEARTCSRSRNATRLDPHTGTDSNSSPKVHVHQADDTPGNARKFVERR